MLHDVAFGGLGHLGASPCGYSWVSATSGDGVGRDGTTRSGKQRWGPVMGGWVEMG